MPGGLTPPDIRATVRSILTRLDLLERRLARLVAFRLVVDIPFTLVDVSVSTSPRYYFAVPGAQVFEVAVSLGTAGSSTTTVTVMKNGNVIATVTLAAGATFKLTKVTSDFTGNQDALTVAVTGAGTGALDLDVQVRAKVAY